jgi:rod shape-determining protein MreD
MISLVMMVGLVLCAMGQALLPAWTWMGQAKAPLLLGAVLYYAFNHNPRYMWQAALLAGLLQDALGRIPLGYSSFCFGLAGLVASRFRDLVFAQAGITHLLSGAVAGLGVTLLLALLLAAPAAELFQAGWIVRKSVGVTLLSALVVPVVFQMMRQLDQLVGNLPTREAP